jgi:hypothetical protein
MISRPLALRNALLAVLQNASPGGLGADYIYSDLRQAIARNLRPAIIIELGDEDAPIREYNHRRRSIALTLRILADGADPYAAIDPIRIDAHTAIMSDKTLGGLCDSLEESASNRERADLDVQIGSLTTIYTARYTTAAELLT